MFKLAHIALAQNVVLNTRSIDSLPALHNIDLERTCGMKADPRR